MADSVQEYLAQANMAANAGDPVLAIHLYLTAFEKAAIQSETPSEDAILGLKRAWQLSVQKRERSLSEYIFEKLEPYLSAGEVQECAAQLQDLSLDKLADLGFDKEQLRDVADMIQQEIGSLDTPLVSIAGGPKINLTAIAAPTANPLNESVPTQPNMMAASDVKTPVATSDGEVKFVDKPACYKDLHGYTSAIRMARQMGIGRFDDPRYKELVAQLNSYHGLTKMPSLDSYIICSEAREDAMAFMQATAGELRLSGITMRMEDSINGAPVLCVMTDKNSKLKYNPRTATLSGRGVLILEDIDMWELPEIEAEEGINGFLMAQLSRGARDAIALMHAAVQSPDVVVLANAVSLENIEPLFADMLEPFKTLDIELPTPGERADVWLDLVHRHPSMRTLDRAELVRFSANMTRFDLYCAAREAVEDTYKQSLSKGTYDPVSSITILEKLANYQSVDSPEYKAIEDAIVLEFRKGSEDIEGLLRYE